MTAAERRDRDSQELISESEELRRRLLDEVEKLEQFVVAFHDAVRDRTEGRVPDGDR
jgi:hypothetical protein